MPTKTLTTKTLLTETKLKEKIYRILDAHFPGHYRRKFAGQFVAGCLDLLVIYKGKWVWFELKILPNKLTLLQELELIKIHNAGGPAYCIAAKQDTGALYLYKGKFDVVEYSNLETLLKEVLIGKGS